MRSLPLLCCVVLPFLSGCQVGSPASGVLSDATSSATSAEGERSRVGMYWYAGCDIGTGPRGSSFAQASDRSWLKIEYTPTDTVPSDTVVLFFRGGHSNKDFTQAKVGLVYPGPSVDTVIHPRWTIDKPYEWGFWIHDRIRITGFGTKGGKLALALRDGVPGKLPEDERHFTDIDPIIPNRALAFLEDPESDPPRSPSALASELVRASERVPVVRLQHGGDLFQYLAVMYRGKALILKLSKPD